MTQLTFINSERNSIIVFTGKSISELNLNLSYSFIIILGLTLSLIDDHTLSRALITFLLRMLLTTTKYLPFDPSTFSIKPIKRLIRKCKGIIISSSKLRAHLV